MQITVKQKEMKIRSFLILFKILIFIISAYGQNKGQIIGTIRDKNTQESIIGASISVEGTSLGNVTDLDGRFKISNIPVGSYNVRASFIGYTSQIRFNLNVTSGNDQIITFLLQEEARQLNEIEITTNRQRSAAAADITTPLSVQSLSSEEIRSNPGGNFDISRVVQVLPGVGGSTGVGGFRNDIIIRGGAPNENVYYLDGIEIPVINHFTTQGSAGGPTGILNISFLEDVKLSSSAFDARHENALASVFQFRQREGNPERFSGNLRLSGTEFATTLEGPISERTNYIVSARRSYLQFLFKAIDLPIRPNYWDFQYKVTHRINQKTTLTAIGVGAIDEFTFAQPRESTPENEYILRSQPIINQWNYTVGLNLKKNINNGFLTFILSRNMFDNNLDRFENNEQNTNSFRLLKVRSQEIENKLRIEVNKRKNGWIYTYGISGQYVKFNNLVFNRIRKEITKAQDVVVQPGIILNFNSEIDFFRYGLFTHFARNFLNNRLGLSAGMRTDMNSFTTTGNNPLKTLSPRISASYILLPKWTVNASVGSYFKLPIYTVLGYQDQEGVFSNQDAKYINSVHYVTGFEFLPREDLRFTVEGFYKDYSNYPVSLRDGISLANQGGDFGAIGNEPVISNGKGRAYGFEFYVQQKLVKNIFAVFSYTFVRSEFSGADGILVPSAWDNRHLISTLLGRKFSKGWEIGLKYRFAGGAPFTPFDLEASRFNYASSGTGILDFSRFNSNRLGAFNQFDFRVDKKWNFKRLTFDLFLDVTNAFLQASPAYPRYIFKRTDDNLGFATIDGQPLQADGSNAFPLILENNDPAVIPTIGFILEF
ncbi:TonB-dependent receptor [soil metagenome]